MLAVAMDSAIRRLGYAHTPTQPFSLAIPFLSLRLSSFLLFSSSPFFLSLRYLCRVSLD